MASKDLKSTKPFIQHLHAFRGLAILTIIGAHAWSLLITFPGGVAKYPHLNGLYSLTETLFHGSTIYFALISGLLYNLILRPRGFSVFFKNKITNVIIPYIIVSILATEIFWSFHLKQISQNESDVRFFTVAIKNIILGDGFFHLWYIPILILLFLLTPILDWLSQCKKTRLMPFIIVLIPLVIARTNYPNLLSWQSFLYFLGAYSLGMLLGEHYSQARIWIARYIVAFWVVALISSIVVFQQIFDKTTYLGLFSIKQTAVYIQKIAMAAIFLDYLAKDETRTYPLLSLLGTHAYPLYLLHAIFAALMVGTIVESKMIPYSVVNIFLTGIAIYILSTILSLMISVLIRRITGKYSRLIIGA